MRVCIGISLVKFFIYKLLNSTFYANILLIKLILSTILNYLQINYSDKKLNVSNKYKSHFTV